MSWFPHALQNQTMSVFLSIIMNAWIFSIFGGLSSCQVICPSSGQWEPFIQWARPGGGVHLAPAVSLGHSFFPRMAVPLGRRGGRGSLSPLSRHRFFPGGRAFWSSQHHPHPSGSSVCPKLMLRVKADLGLRERGAGHPGLGTGGGLRRAGGPVQGRVRSKQASAEVKGGWRRQEELDLRDPGGLSEESQGICW